MRLLSATILGLFACLVLAGCSYVPEQSPPHAGIELETLQEGYTEDTTASVGPPTSASQQEAPASCKAYTDGATRQGDSCLVVREPADSPDGGYWPWHLKATWQGRSSTSSVHRTVVAFDAAEGVVAWWDERTSPFRPLHGGTPG